MKIAAASNLANRTLVGYKRLSQTRSPMLKTNKLSHRTLLLLVGMVMLIAISPHAAEPGKEILLWPNGAPGSEGDR